MKTDKKDNEKMTAIEFMRTYDDTLQIIENIGNETVKEQEAIMESEGKNNFTNEEGIFKMESLLDVEIPGNAEMNQPRYYNSPVEPLTDGDKSLIVDEFTNMLKNMHEEVIDFSDIGPVATVIQNKLGYKQNLEDFLSELITTAVDKQDSQAFAHGSQPVPGLKGKVDVAPVAGGEGPTDIAPVQVSPEAPVEAAPVLDITAEVPITDMTAEGSPISDVVPEVAPGAEMAPELPGEEIAPAAEMAPEVPAEIAPELTSEEVAPSTEIAPELPGEEIAPATDMAPEIPAEEVTDEVAPISEPVPEEKKEDEKEEDEEKEEDVDAKLEAIKSEYKGKINEKKIDAQLEAIKNKVLKAKVEGASETKTPEPKKEEVVEPQVESVTKETEVKETAIPEPKEDIKAKLEAIANEYHDGEKAKIEAVKKEEKVNAQLEAIVTNYHNTEKAKVEAVVAEKKLDEKLSSLVESYHKSTEQAQLENIEQRKQVKAKIDEVSK